MSTTAAEADGRRSPDPRATWTAEDLRALVASVCGGRSLIVLANREPLRHDYAPDGRITSTRSAGGLVTALEPLIKACSGVWVAHGSGTADAHVVDAHDRVDVPLDAPQYRLRRVWLDPREERGYYHGFANEGLWPLCHRAHVQPIFRSADFTHYRAVNARFADAVCQEAERDAPLVLVQDYHFALAPALIRRHLPHATIVTFWHIPFPDPRDFAICPYGRQLLEGLLGSNILGFQTPEDCRNFTDTVREMGGEIHPHGDLVVYRGRRTMVHAYPVSVEWPCRRAAGTSVEGCGLVARRRLGLNDDIRLAVGVDRLDYTKGINEKFLAVERLLDAHPEWRTRFAFVQVAEPSRESIDAYRQLRVRVKATAERINARFGAGDHQPIRLLDLRHDPDEVHQLLCAADVCYVGSLHDGMNLVAKEFVGARRDHRGVLILSRFAGAARELSEALLVNPYAVNDCAETLVQALTMPAAEQASRMHAMRSTVSQFNTYRWAAEILADVAHLRGSSVSTVIPVDFRRVDTTRGSSRVGRSF